MKNIIEKLHSPEWWFTAVIVAIVASLIAAYVKAATDRLGRRVVDAVNARLEAQRRDDSDWLEFLAAEQEARIRSYIFGNSLFIVGILTAILGFVALSIEFEIRWSSGNPGAAPAPLTPLIFVGFGLWMNWVGARASARARKAARMAREQRLKNPNPS